MAARGRRQRDNRPDSARPGSRPSSIPRSSSPGRDRALPRRRRTESRFGRPDLVSAVLLGQRHRDRLVGLAVEVVRGPRQGGKHPRTGRKPEALPRTGCRSHRRRTVPGRRQRCRVFASMPPVPSFGPGGRRSPHTPRFRPSNALRGNAPTCPGMTQLCPWPRVAERVRMRASQATPAASSRGYANRPRLPVIARRGRACRASRPHWNPERAARRPIDTLSIFASCRTDTDSVSERTTVAFLSVVIFGDPA